MNDLTLACFFEVTHLVTVLFFLWVVIKSYLDREMEYTLMLICNCMELKLSSVFSLDLGLGHRKADSLRNDNS